jgi:hypothetical protein
MSRSCVANLHLATISSQLPPDLPKNRAVEEFAMPVEFLLRACEAGLPHTATDVREVEHVRTLAGRRLVRASVQDGTSMATIESLTTGGTLLLAHLAAPNKLLRDDRAPRETPGLETAPPR